MTVDGNGMGHKPAGRPDGGQFEYNRAHYYDDDLDIMVAVDLFNNDGGRDIDLFHRGDDDDDLPSYESKWDAEPDVGELEDREASENDFQGRMRKSRPRRPRGIRRKRQP